MLNVMIVEDETLVRIGLKSIVNWDALEMQVGADRANGAEALDTWRLQRADIVITDIKMPRMDGLELMRQIRAVDHRTRFIVLTCLDEFDILKQAMDLDITAYILKLSSTQEDVEKALQKAKGELAEFGGLPLSDRWVDYGAVAGQLLRDYLVPGTIPAREFVHCMEQLDSALRLENMLVAAFSLPEGFTLAESAQDPYGYKLHGTVVNLLQKKLEDVGAGRVMFDQARHYVALVCPRHQLDAAGTAAYGEEVVQALKDELLSALNAAAQAGLSDPAPTAAALPACYRQAVERVSSASAVPHKVAATLDYIARNYQRPISIQDAARNAGVSAGYLAHMLTRHAGGTFNDCLNRLRIERAKKLLANPDSLVAEVGHAVGVPNTTYFTRLFKKYVGTSPREYRRGLGL